MVNTDTQPIITSEMGTVISVVSDRDYTVSVMAVADNSRRTEPDRESVTAGGAEDDVYIRVVDCVDCVYSTYVLRTYVCMYLSMYVCMFVRMYVQYNKFDVFRCKSVM